MDRDVQKEIDRVAFDAPRRGTVASGHEIVVAFDASELKAPFVLRCGAAALDYIVLIAIPVIGLVLTQLTGSAGAAGSALPGTAGWLLTALVALSNFIILPAMSGQSVGKMLTGLRIVTLAGKAPSTASMIVRNVPGYLLTVCSAGLGFLLSAVTPRGRALHDYLAGTVVIYAKRRQL